MDDLVRQVTQFLQHRASVLLLSKERPPWDLQPEEASQKRTKFIKPRRDPTLSLQIPCFYEMAGFTLT